MNSYVIIAVITVFVSLCERTSAFHTLKVPFTPRYTELTLLTGRISKLASSARRNQGIDDVEILLNKNKLHLHRNLNGSSYSKTILASSSSNSPDRQNKQKDELIISTSQALRKCSWFSWWTQVILSTVSGVTLLFARSVLMSGIEGKKRGAEFILAGSGIVLSIISVFWTWGGARISKRLMRRPSTTRIKAANLLRRNISVGLTLNLLGMFLTLLGAEQIVGMLAAKVLTQQGAFSGGSAVLAGATVQSVQPLDILIVQANTNTLLSHFVSVVCGLYLTRFVDRLDPPSVSD